MKKHLKETRKKPILPVFMILLGGVCLFLLLTTLWLHQKTADQRDRIRELETELADREAQLEEACSAAAVTPKPTTTPTPKATPEPSKEPEYLGDLEEIQAETLVENDRINWDKPDTYFASYEISDKLFERIYGDDRSYKTYCTIPRENLRYIQVLHYGFDGKIYVGELMVNADLAQEIIEIFKELFENQYQIDKMYLVDHYNADDDLSCLENNTSAFNYRMVTGGSTLSNHAFGCAIDINPVNNPYVTFHNGSAYVVDEKAQEYLDRDPKCAKEKHMITHEDLCFKLFTEHGWTWGGDWSSPIDYQHFEKNL